MSRRDTGFTLIEVLMALVVFSLVVSLTYAAIGPAGEGFRRLQDVRENYEQNLATGWQLNQDIAYMLQPLGEGQSAFDVVNDNRGEYSYDELWLVSATPARPGLSEIHYYIDEETHVLIRESGLLDARDDSVMMQTELGPADSLQIEMLDKAGRWHQRWDMLGGEGWPRAFRIQLHHGKQLREWLVPVLQGHL